MYNSSANTMSPNIKLAIVVSHPIQHFVHFYREITKLDEIDLLVIYASDMGARAYYDDDMQEEISWNMDMLSGYENIVLIEANKINKTSFFTVNNPSVVDALSTYNPDVVMLNGYSQLTTLRALVWCQLKNVPTLLWSDSNLHSKRSLVKRVIKYPILVALFKIYHLFLAVGDNNEQYYLHYLVDKKKIFRVPFTIDEQKIKNCVRKKKYYRNEFRQVLNISSNAFIALFIGKIIERKRPMDLIQAILAIQHKVNNERPIYAVFAGSGSMLPELKSFCVDNNIACIFLGFVNVDILPSTYVSADVFVHTAGSEPYGLVVKEAACAGLPIILNNQIGAVGPNDAAREHKNAFVYNCGDVSKLAELLMVLYESPDMIESMSQESLKISHEIGMQQSILGLTQALQNSVQQS